MKVLELLPIGNLDDGLLLDLGPALASVLHVPCEIVPGRMDPAFAFHRERQQYHSSEILARHAETSYARIPGACWAWPLSISIFRF